MKKIMLPEKCYQWLLVLCIQIIMTNAAPLLLIPTPWMAQSMQQIVLQKQLMELQALQKLSAQSPFQINNQAQPLIVLLPNDQSNENINSNQHSKLKNDKDQKTAIHTKFENEDDDLNSIVIDAESEVTENGNHGTYSQPQRTILLVPNGRLSIGDVVSAIPWLPIEINVPDTISWAYNGIASGIGSIISIIGTPFQGASQGTQKPAAGLKSLLNQIQTNEQNIMRPIIMMPIDGPMLPIKV